MTAGSSFAFVIQYLKIPVDISLGLWHGKLECLDARVRIYRKNGED